MMRANDKWDICLERVQTGLGASQEGYKGSPEEGANPEKVKTPS